MIADLFDIKRSKIQDKGVFARQFVPKGTIIYFDCGRCRPWTKEELAGLSKEELRFAFVHNSSTKYCDERLLYNNHSCDSNTLDIGDDVSIVVRDIKKGEEQTEDYRVYSMDDVRFKGGCKCGAPNCMKRKAHLLPPRKELLGTWAKEIDDALRSADKVGQPLKRELLKVHPELRPLFGRDEKKRNRVIASLGKARANGMGGLGDDLEKVYSLAGLTRKIQF
ncbi:MAG: hypothetical protein KGH98_03915 [Candidatus Micrarchaeota archaeon]|nr:hypothetical protein [Candidatus Micrarchaeota archaeon]